MIRLLIVDDEYYIRLGIKNAIDWKSIGIEIVGEAEDGEQGLAMALELEPDLLLMDIRMPVMDGYEAARTIRSLKDPKQADIPIIAMTANAFEEDRRAAFEAGMNGHISKPVDIENLLRVIHDL